MLPAIHIGFHSWPPSFSHACQLWSLCWLPMGISEKPPHLQTINFVFNTSFCIFLLIMITHIYWLSPPGLSFWGEGSLLIILQRLSVGAPRPQWWSPRFLHKIASQSELEKCNEYKKIRVCSFNEHWSSWCWSTAWQWGQGMGATVTFCSRFFGTTIPSLPYQACQLCRLVMNTRTVDVLVN